MPFPDQRVCIEWGVAERAHPREQVSGDSYFVHASPERCLFAAVDGIGHGEEAEKAAKAAISSVEANMLEPLPTIIRKCHEDLRRSRGVVLSLASIDIEQNVLNWIGVGNVDGVVISGHHEIRLATGSLPLRGGVVGGRLPSLHVSSIPISHGDLVIFATDGISHAYSESVSSSGTAQQIADRIMTRFYKSCDDALVLVARYIGALK
jgi:serine phosphatase RsbU (regulator of sigma subunit)